MSEKEARKNEAPVITVDMISKGTLELAKPIRARSEDVDKLHYDFLQLTGWEYAQAMDSDPGAKNVFITTKKQGLALFAAAAAKCTRNVDAKDILERIGISDAQNAARIATLFLNASAREAGRNTYGEWPTQQ